MIPRVAPPDRLVRLAEAQDQVLSTEQLRAFGVGRTPTERMIDEGRWQRVARGVVQVRPGAPSWLGLAWAGVLLGGEGSRLGGSAALHLHGVVEQPDLMVVHLPARVRRVDQQFWSFRREQPGVRRSARGEPPRVSLEDAALDLCATAGEVEVIDLLTRVVQRRRTTPARLLRRLEERERLANRRLVRSVLGDVAAGAQSPLELGYLREVELAHGLPRGRRQVVSGRFVRDVCYEACRTVVELDGRLGHEGLGRFRDMNRDNLALLSGQVTLRFGWRDVRGDPCRVAALVAAVLTQRGWDGQLMPCPRCRTRQ